MNNPKIQVAAPYILEDDVQAVADCVRSTWLSMGPGVAEFEAMVADYTGVKHAIAMNNGTSTLHAALAALGVGPGDEVIVPNLTYISTVNVVFYVGATPVLCESNPTTYNVDVEHIEAKITARTKAIITVDMNGLPIDFDAFAELQNRTGIPIISDSAESMGTLYKGTPVGGQLRIHSFSFFPNKNVTTGEGGMLTTNDDALATELRILRNQGQDSRYHHIRLGYNFRMTDIQASLGKVQFSRLEWAMERKRLIAKHYFESLAGLKGLTLPEVPDYASRPSWYMFTVSIETHEAREALIKKLDDKGIETRCSFPPVSIQPFHSKAMGLDENSYPVSFKAWSKLLNLPVGLGLSTEELEYVSQAITEALPEVL